MNCTDVTHKKYFRAENVAFQAFPHKCPCPFMIVPTEVLRGSSWLMQPSRSSAFEDQSGSAFWSTPITTQSLFSRRAWPFGAQKQSTGRFSLSGRRCLSLDSTEQNQGLKPVDYSKHDDSIELSTSAQPDADRSGTRMSSRSTERLIPGSSSEAPDSPAMGTSVSAGGARRETVVRRLQKQLMEKEREVRSLKQQIRHLQNV